MAYRIEGVSWQGDEPHWQTALARVHQARQRPLCACTQAGLEVYVAFLAGVYVIKRMPGTGARHACHCPHFEPPLSVSGEGLVLGDAIVEDEAGRVTLKLDFPLVKYSGRAPPAVEESAVAVARTDGARLTMRALLHYLWSEAGLHQWSPAMRGKRTYGTFFKYVQRAAAQKMARGLELSELLVIPPPGEADAAGRASQAAVMQHRLAKATVGPCGSRRLALVLGEIYAIEPGGMFGRVKLKCMLDRPLSVPLDLYERMTKRFAANLSMWQPGQDRLVMLASFYCDTSGVPLLQEVALMNLCAEWIPFETLFEQELVRVLTANDRRFLKSLRFNVPASIPMASAVLTDIGDPAAALFIDVPSEAGAGLAEQIEEAGKQGLRTWCWKPGEALLDAATLPVSLASGPVVPRH